MVARPRRLRRRLPDLPDGRGLAHQARAVRRRRRSHRPRRFPAQGSPHHPRSRGDRARDLQLRTGQEERHRKRPVGPRIHQAEHGRLRRLSRRELDRRHRSHHGAQRQVDRRPAAQGQARRSGAWCRRPATAARCSSAATPTFPTICRTRISSSSRAIRQAQHHLDAVLERHPVPRHERHQAAVRQSRRSGRRWPTRSRTRRSWMRCCSACRSRCSARRPSKATEVAWPQPHKFNTDIAKAKELLAEAGYPERLRDHAVVRSRLCRRQRAALRA